jgi:molybdopterin biosynthesis enzyme
MDGFALAGIGPWLLRTGEINAGSDPGQPLNSGEAVRVATGALTPAGTTAVLRTEHARVCGPRVIACGDIPGAGRDVRTRGELGGRHILAGPDGTGAVDLHARTPDLATLVGRPALALVDTGSRWAELIQVPR